jgi:hypothetical protein
VTRTSTTAPSTTLASTSTGLALLGADLPPAALDLLATAPPEQRAALVEALRSAYDRGREEGDRRSALQLARVFGALVGMEPAVDREQGAERGLARRVMERFRRGG